MRTRLLSFLSVLSVLCLSPTAAGQAPIGGEDLSRHEGTLERVELIQRRRDAVNRTRAYTLATYSFQMSTRDEVELVHNDWDIQITHTKTGPMVHVNMVTDDRSGIADLGVVPLQKVKKSTRSLDYARHADVPVVVGHTYLVHTKDSDSELWSRFKVVEADDVRVVLVGEAFAGRFGRPEKERAERRRGRVVVDDPRGVLDEGKDPAERLDPRKAKNGRLPLITVRTVRSDSADRGATGRARPVLEGRAAEARAKAARSKAEAARRAREAELTRREKAVRDAESRAQALKAAREAGRKARERAARDARRRGGV